MTKEILTDEKKLGGEPYLEETRIRVSDIAIKYEELSYTLEEIEKAYERLGKRDIEKALSYYYRNKERFRQIQGEPA
ncbi:MAG: hypothetical protein ACI9LV_000904 [Candidatus Nanohaloarchaea archaeon]|jgi:uncharacterized protein (DUF433 family)